MNPPCHAAAARQTANTHFPGKTGQKGVGWGWEATGPPRMEMPRWRQLDPSLEVLGESWEGGRRAAVAGGSRSLFCLCLELTQLQINNFTI